MKEKKLVAMLITSVVAFVISLSVSLGVSFAFAEPYTPATIQELTYTLSSQRTQTKSAVLDPTGSFNNQEEIADYVFVNTYDDILFVDEATASNIRILKISVKNDTATSQKFNLYVNVTGSNASKYAKATLFNADGSQEYENLYQKQEGLLQTQDIEIASNTTQEYVIAVYIDDTDVTEVVDLSTRMTMEIIVDRIEM